MNESCLRYQGSKKLMIQKYRIHEFIPKTNHDTPYVELFCGSAIMFFNLEHPGFAFLNDKNKNLINFWNVVKSRRAEFEAALQYVWPSRHNTDWIHDMNDSVERAVLYYLNNTQSQFITKPSTLQKDVSWWANKLNACRMYIDDKSFEDEIDFLMKLYTSNNEDRILSLIFYEDPPYWGSEDVYKSYQSSDGINQKPEPFDHDLLATKNHELAAKDFTIVLSYNDCAEIRALYADWHIMEFAYSPNGCGNNKALPRTELLLSNKPLIRQLPYKKLNQFWNQEAKK